MKKTDKETEPKKEIEYEDFKSLLPCQLTDKDLIERGQKLADTQELVRQLSDTMSSIKKEYGAKIAGAEAELSCLSGIVRTRREIREVDCRRVLDYNAGTVVEKRLDTFDVIHERAMNANEKQRKLEL